MATLDRGVGVELDHDTPVLERVLLDELDVVLLADGAQGALDLIRVDDAAQVGVGELGVRERVAVLLGGLGGERAKDGIEGLEGALGPDDEAAEVTSGRELEEVEARDVGGLDAGQVAEAERRVLLVVDDERATALHVAAVAGLALAGAHAVRVLGGLHVVVGVERLEERHGGLGLAEVVEGGVGHHERDLGQLLDLVAASEHERRERRRSEGRRDREALLVHVDLAVPAAPRLGRREHAAATAHVAEGTLAGAVRTTARDTRNTRHGATGTPRDGARLVAGLDVDGVRLAAVLRQVRVHELHNVKADRRRKNGRERHLRAHVALVAIEDSHEGAHCNLGLQIQSNQPTNAMTVRNGGRGSEGDIMRKTRQQQVSITSMGRG